MKNFVVPVFVITSLVSFLVFYKLIDTSHNILGAATEVKLAQTTTPTPEATPAESSTPLIKLDVSGSEKQLSPLERVLNKQRLGPVWPMNPIKYAIRSAVNAGVPTNTIVLLLLLTVVAALIAATRHLFGVRGFGIFMPAALSVVFVATGPVVGIILFLVIVFASTSLRIFLRRLKIRMQYLPRMALMLWVVVLAVLGVLFLTPFLAQPDFTNVSIFPVLILALLAEEFSKVQLGKSIRVAIGLTTESLVLALISFTLLTWSRLQEFALLNPELLLGGVVVFNVVISRYLGLRLRELWRFRKIITG